jgi:hypothetical protein
VPPNHKFLATGLPICLHIGLMRDSLRVTNAVHLVTIASMILKIAMRLNCLYSNQFV